MELLLVLLLLVIGIYHMALSVQVLTRRRPPVSAGAHCLLLFSNPAILMLSVIALVPTTFPGLFVIGIDADDALKHVLELTSFLGWLCLGGFTTNLFLVICACHR